MQKLDLAIRFQLFAWTNYVDLDLEYVDIQNLYNFKQDGAPNLILDDSFGDNNGYGMPARYHLKEVVNQSGTVLPTIGIIVEF